MKNHGYFSKMSRKSYASVVNLVKMLALACGRVFSKHDFDGARSSKSGWKAVLKDLAGKIEDLNSSTEREFLEIGEMLQGFYRSAKEISRESEAVTGLMSGERVTAAIEGLRGIFGRIEGMQSESQQLGEALDGILRTLGGVDGSLAGFNRFIQTLKVFCISIRIESARLGSSDIGFDTLADDINKLASDIAARSTTIIDRLDSLTALIGMNLYNVRKLEATHSGQIRTIIAQTQSSLATLVENHGISNAASMRIGSRYVEFSRKIGEIVSSMQFHDITRQQMEHAATALKQIASGSPDSTATSGAIELQALQLRFAGGKLDESVNDIVEYLRTAALDIAEISNESLAVAGAGGDEEDSFMHGMEERLSSINSALHECGHAKGQLASSMGSITASMTEMTGFVNDIERIGIAIKLIALNAVVKAAHIGERGAALGVLADSIHQLSFETGQQTGALSETFKSVVIAAERLRTGADMREDPSGKVLDQMAVKLGTLVGTLHEVNESIASHLRAIDGAGNGLLREIEDAAGGIHVHEEVAELIGEVASGLDGIAAALNAAIPTDVPAQNADRKAEVLKSLEESYTMNSERDLHSMITPLSASAPSPVDAEIGKMIPGAGGESSHGDEGEFGDNVELF
jgi:methyl-accepting chemotaxis protein